MSYMTKKLLKIDTEKMNRLIKKCSKESNKPRFIIFLDMAYCVLKYKSGYVDYSAFAMYDLNRKERKSILTRGKNNDYVKMLNPKEYWHVLDNKNEFNKKFKEYLNRDFFVINNKKEEYKDFEKFIEKHQEIIVKPTNQSCGVGISKIKVTKDHEKLYNKLIKDETYLLEEVAIQHKDMAKLHPTSINTIRLVTIKNKFNITSVIAAYIRIGTNNRVVDNFNNGGITCPIDIETGKIKAPAVDKNGDVYKIHPTTNIKLIGYQIPMWNEVLNFVKNVSHVYPKLNYVGWDICIGPEKPCLIEGNQYPGHDIYQLPVHRQNNKYGMVPVIEEALNKKK